MRRSMLTAALLLLAAADCHGESDEVADLRRAKAMATGDSLAVWPKPDAGRPVVLYVDRSQSMRGFLDPAYPGRVATDYRAVIDGFDARLTPSQVYGFGNEVRAAEGQGLVGVLGNKDFYSDGNTEIEEVFPLISGDSTASSTHVLIGDGRRGNPDAANGQFVRMRALADQWIGRGGAFIVASSAAPFQPVANDPAGCGDTDRQTCPLYAFAFVAPGDQGRVAAALASVFQNLYVTPLPALPGSGVIPGWTEALLQMKKGGSYRLWIPPELAYGPQGAGNGVIPPNSVLDFDVTLVDVAPNAALGMMGGMGGGGGGAGAPPPGAP